MSILTLDKLHELTKNYLDRGISPKTPIYVTTADSSVGARAHVIATGLYNGFDWERGQLRIETEEKILKYENTRDNKIVPRIHIFVLDGRRYVTINCPKCDNKLHKGDYYCSKCGQAIKSVEG